jgi:hypothetical protein
VLCTASDPLKSSCRFGKDEELSEAVHASRRTRSRRDSTALCCVLMPRVTGAGAWAKPKHRRPRANFWHQRPPRRASVPTGTGGLEDPAWSPADEENAHEAPGVERPVKLDRAVIARMVIHCRARQLWQDDFTPLLELEAKETPELRAQVDELYGAQRSTYRARLKDTRLIERYDIKQVRMVRDATALLRRRRNQLDLPFSVMARSLSWFNQRVPTRVWRDNQRSLRIVHRDSCMKLLDAMLEVEPQPPWLENQYVSVFGVDQNNCWQVAANSKKGAHRGAERLTAQGMPVAIRSETVLNIVQKQIPFTAPLLTADEIKLIKEKGPYTEDFQLVKLLLDPRAVDQSETAWMQDMMFLLGGGDDTRTGGDEGAIFCGGDDAPQLPTTESEVVDRVLGKPSEKPKGRCWHKIHPSIPNCETQSFMDCAKMMACLLTHCFSSCLCVVIFCDGQLVDLLRTCKRRWPSDYLRVLVANGMFHSLSHLSFCVNEGYWWCCCCVFAMWQGKQKQIYHHIPDLQHDNAKHALDFHRVNAAAIMAYLTLDVTNPPPALLLRDYKAYAALVRVAGGKVIIDYLTHGAVPILSFQRAIRKGGPKGGKQITRCMAFAFHCFRSWAEKTKSVYITMVALMGLACAHPKLQAVLTACCCISPLGRVFQAFDRFLERLNDMQLKRGTAFRGFDSQLHFTHYLKAMVHVDMAWKEADGARNGLDDGVASYLYNDIAEMRRKLREALGPDLTKVVRGNALWHTGNHVPLDGHDYRERTPSAWRDDVAAGTSRGKGRKHATSWVAWVDDFLANHWWPQPPP